MRNVRLVCCLLLVQSCAVIASAGMVQPLGALAPASTPAGEVEVRMGVDYSAGEWGMFQAGDTDRQLCRAPDLTVVFGVADNVELILQYPGLFLKQNGGGFNIGTGDLKVTGIYNLAVETEFRPKCALVVTTKLPNANFPKGFGTDQIDFFLGGAFSKALGPVTVLANLRLGLLENPVIDETAQDDVLVYDIGVAGALTDSVTAGLELSGIYNSLFGNDRSVLRAGVAWKMGSTVVDFNLGTGLDDKSGGLHVGAGVTMGFDLNR